MHTTVIYMLAALVSFTVALDLDDTQSVASIAQSNPTVRFAFPMERIFFPALNETLIGTDEDNCANKDPSGSNVKAGPTAGFVEFPFAAPEAARYHFVGHIRAPDSLANSFHLQFDNDAKKTFSTKKSKTVMQMDVTADVGDDKQYCFPLSAGAHTIRLYVREPGAAIARLDVEKVGKKALTGVSGCDPCKWDTSLVLNIGVSNFCGPNDLHPHLILVDGKPCDQLLFMGGNLTCRTHKLQPTDRALRITLNESSSSTLTVAAGIELPMEPVPTFPTWAIAVLVIVGLLIVAGAAYPPIAKFLKVRNAPKDDAKPITTIFITLRRIAELQEHFPDTYGGIVAEFMSIVRAAADSSGCYTVRHLGTAVLIVCNEAHQAQHFADSVMQQLLKKDWSKLLVICEKKHHITGRNSQRDRMSSKKSKLSSKKPHSAAHSMNSPTARSTSEDSTSACNHTRPHSAPTRVEVSIGVHSGKVSIVYDAPTHTYNYLGSVIDETAIVADAARPSQVLFSQPTMTGLSNASSMGVFTSCPLSAGGDSTNSGGVDLFQYNPTKCPVMDFTAVDEGSSAEDNGDSIASTLQQANTGVTSKRISVIYIRFEDNKMLSGSRLAMVRDRIHEIVADTKGDLTYFYNSTAIVTYNAKAPSVAHVRKSIISAMDIVNTLQGEDFNVTASCVTGKALVGEISGTFVVAGDPVTLSEQLSLTAAQLKESFDRKNAGADVPSILCPATSFDEANIVARCQFVTTVERAGSLRGVYSPMYLRESPAEQDDKDMEWMYELEEADVGNPYVPLNKAFKQLLEGDVDTAKATYEKWVEKVTDIERTACIAGERGLKSSFSKKT